MDILSILLVLAKIGAVFGFIFLIWPLVKAEKWKQKFIENKHAKSLLIVFILIAILSVTSALYIDLMWSVDTLK